MQHNLRSECRLRSSYALALALLALACNGDSPTDPPDGTGELAALVVTPDSLAFAALGDSAQLAAVALDAAGNEVAGVVVGWTNTDAAVATVNDAGWVVASGNGAASVVASIGTLADTVPVAVAQAEAGVEASPASIELHALGDSVRLTAVARDANGNEVAGAAVLWASLDPGVAAVSPTGWVAASGNGTATVVASAGGAADTVEVEVAQVMAALEVSPSVVSVGAGDTVRLVAMVVDSNGIAVEGAPAVAWTSADEGVATVDGTGLVTGVARGGETRITAAAGGMSGEVAVSVPDQLAFVSLDIGDYEIYVVNADGSGLTNLTNDDGNDLRPAWSPDGSRIAFTSNRDGNSEIYVMNADGSVPARLTNDPSIDSDPAWSPDGTKILFTSDRDGNAEIYVMDADGRGPVNLTNDPGVDADAAWSPDGTRIVFRSDRDGDADIYVVNADGSGLMHLTNNAGTDSRPVWSPDGSRIAFGRRPDLFDADIFVVNADGSGLRHLTNDDAVDVRPAWSPDGGRIAFRRSRAGNIDIHVMNADGSGLTNLTNDDGDDREPVWSPDGTKIAFESLRDGNLDVYVMNANGSGRVKLTNSAGNGSSPAWRPRP